MRDSFEQFSWNLVADSKSSRIVFATIPKKFVCEGTFDAILEIFAWSMKQLLLRLMPSVRHDGTPFDKSDSDDRKKVAGEILPFGACLVQIRGDWAFYKGFLRVSSLERRSNMLVVPSNSCQRVATRLQATDVVGLLFVCVFVDNKKNRNLYDV
jgi:hypothetical protein